MNGLFIILIILGTFAAFLSTPENATKALFDSAELAVTISIGLLGVMAFFLGLFKVAENSGLMSKLAHKIEPLLAYLFPELPSGAKAFSSMSMNLSANALGLGNAATPFGIKAMQHLKDVASKTDEATRAMMVFLVINTSSVTLVPTKVIALRVAAGSTEAASILVPTLFATFMSTAVGLLVVLTAFPSEQSRNFRVGKFLVGLATFCGALFLLTQLYQYVLLSFVLALVLYGAYRRVDVYNSFVEGAGEAIPVIVRIIPFLVVVLSAIGFFRSSGAFDYVINTITPVTDLLHMPAEVLPLAFLRPLSGGGSLAYLTELLSAYGPDSTIGLMASTMIGSTETTFYVLAVYFGAVGIKKAKGVLLPALSADMAGAMSSVVAIHFWQENLYDAMYTGLAMGFMILCAWLFAWRVRMTNKR